MKKGLGWKDIDVVILGNISVHIQAISYRKRKNKSNRYGRGGKVQSRHRGNDEYEVSMTLAMEEAELIEKAILAKYGVDPTELDAFDIPISISNGEKFVLDIIKDFEWTEWGRDTQQGDLGIDMQLPGICSDIKFNAPI